MDDPALVADSVTHAGLCRRQPIFALAVCLSRGTYGVRLHDVKQYFLFSSVMFVVYILLVSVQYLLLEKKLGSWLPLFFPLLILALIKYVPGRWTQSFVPTPFSNKVFADFSSDFPIWPFG